MSTSSPLKNDKSPLSPTEEPDFASWKPENLVKFAQETYVALRQQQDEIERLRQDRKTAMEAYRDLLRR
jgi:hypothetical protein